MTFERKISKVFRLNEENWMRHANPISVYTRYSCLPIIVLAFWSRVWIGWWCAIPAGVSLLWMMFNPVLFKKPKSTKNWASKSVLGERVYLNRDAVALPEIHQTPLYAVLNGISGAGLSVAIWAVVVYSVWGAVLGTALTIIGKSWFLDRMVWLYESMKTDNDEYASWEY
ncbi:MAG: hypothetical protein JXR76_05650 [Deltaproteobacteria bacterium]|nr:hypothetical protein [Deltaproteobacteria bacterium]